MSTTRDAFIGVFLSYNIPERFITRYAIEFLGYDTDDLLPFIYKTKLLIEAHRITRETVDNVNRTQGMVPDAQ